MGAAADGDVVDLEAFCWGRESSGGVGWEVGVSVGEIAVGWRISRVGGSNLGDASTDCCIVFSNRLGPFCVMRRETWSAQGKGSEAKEEY